MPSYQPVKCSQLEEMRAASREMANQPNLLTGSETFILPNFGESSSAELVPAKNSTTNVPCSTSSETFLVSNSSQETVSSATGGRSREGSENMNDSASSCHSQSSNASSVASREFSGDSTVTATTTNTTNMRTNRGLKKPGVIPRAASK